MNLDVRELRFGSPEQALTIALRTRILRDPLGLAFAPEDLARETGDTHLGAFSGAALVGCLVLTPKSAAVVKMRQVAVAADAQGRGVGRALVAFSEALAFRRGFREMQLSARDSAIPFYLALGYEAVGAPFVEVGISHRTMVRGLERSGAL